MNHATQAKHHLNRANTVGTQREYVPMVEALMGIGHALLAIHGELVERDEVLPSRGLASVVDVVCEENANGDNVT